MTSFVRHFYTKQTTILKLLKSSFLQEISISSRSYTSALYVPGKLAYKSFAFLSPDLDFAHRFDDLQKLQKELNSRGLDIDTKALKDTWDYYQYVLSNKSILEEKLNKLSSQIKNIQMKGNLTPECEKEIQVLIMQCKMIKQNLKTIKEANWVLEETFVPQLLKLPNEINECTPLDAPVVLKSVGEKPNIPDHKKKNHLEIGKSLNLLDYRNPIQCYLCNDAVSFELGIIRYACKTMSEGGVIQVAGPDFSRSLVVEGCGLDHENPTDTFILQSADDTEKDHVLNRLHLVGGASLPALLAIFTKQVVKTKFLPIKIFTSGRQYIPFPNTPANYGLFAVCQASAVQALTLLKDNDSEGYKNEFQNLVDLTSRIYDTIGCHYRLVLRSAKELNLSDGMRVSFEMWSAYSNQYIEVGNVSACGDYFSKRLLIGSQSSNRCKYTSVITGTLISVPKLLGCLLEQNPEKFVLPDKLKDFAI
ncbi:serine--tRNA synthetase-like protein Slimp [Phymastichus coffea]|uniref:serine--tRNA synthetase-like protein Slimp n=1 Tax=Phymastichus coffea TaxID=108790 RepID=UPI00273C9AA5|nr:serine--tRNA synthetase-like protein Slimp [Phymastichus coffea]